MLKKVLVFILCLAMMMAFIPAAYADTSASTVEINDSQYIADSLYVVKSDNSLWTISNASKTSFDTGVFPSITYEAGTESNKYYNEVFLPQLAIPREVMKNVAKVSSGWSGVMILTTDDKILLWDVYTGTFSVGGPFGGFWDDAAALGYMEGKASWQAKEVQPDRILSGYGKIKCIFSSWSYFGFITESGDLYTISGASQGTPVVEKKMENAEFASDCLVIKSDGTLWMGSSDKYTKIMDGVKHCYSDSFTGENLVVKNDNSLWGWQYDDISNMKHIMDDVKLCKSSMAIKNNNTLWTWDDDSTPVKILDNVQYCNDGLGACYAVTSDGTVWGWGANDNKQLGPFAGESSATPLKIMTGAKVDSTSSNVVAPSPKKNVVNIVINGESVAFSETSGQPFIDSNNRTLVPMRVVLEKYGCIVEWDQPTKTATVIKGDVTVQVPIGKSDIVINGKTTSNDAPAQVISGRTYLPIRAVLEAVGAQVIWDNSTKSVIVTD